MPLDKLSREDLMLGGAALVLVISLLFFPWFSISIGPFTATSSGTGEPDGWLGILGMLAALAVLVDLAIERFSPQTSLPALGGTRASTRFVLAAAAAVFVVLKFLFHINHFSDLGWGFWLSAIAAGALVYFALKARGGSISMPSMSRGGSPPTA
jgi:hypothetical protein